MEHRTNAHKLVLWLLAALSALSALCAALALAVLLPGGARAAHAAENGHAEHGTDWTALFAEGGKLTGGNYYLAADVELTTALTVSGPVTLCLNGYVLTGAGSGAVIKVESGGDFTLCDCQSESAETEHRHAYYVDGNGKYVFVTDTVTYFYGQFYLSCACCCTINFRSGSVCDILKALRPSYS